MRIRLLLILLVFIYQNDFAQALTEMNCFKGEKQDALKSIEPLSATDYLLNIRSNSNTQYFARTLSSQDSTYLNSSWLFRVNDDGDTIWKQRIPNTHKTQYLFYLINFNGYFPVAINDYAYSIYSKIGNELFLHYAYYDLLGTSIINTDNSTKNNLLTVGILNNSDGSYAVNSFVVDTLQTVVLDTSLRISNCVSHKINDSVYQMATQFYKQKLVSEFDITTLYYTNFYSININSKKVEKQSYEGYEIRLINAENRFFILQDNGADLLIKKIALDGNIETETSLKTIDALPVINFVKTVGNGKLLIGGEESNSTDSTSRTDAVLFSVNTTDLSFTKQVVNNHSTAVVSANYFYPSSSNFLPVNAYDESANSFSDNSPYCFFSESYQQEADMINANSVVRLNKQTGAVVWTKDATNYSVLASDAQQNGIMLFKDSSYTTPDLFSFYHSTIQKIDSNGIVKWITSLPDSLLINGNVYFQYNTIGNYFSLNYKNQFIIKTDYLDKVNNAVLPIHFLVNNITGAFKRMLFYTDTEIPTNVFEPTYFFTSPINNLSVVIKENDKCLANADIDVVIYKYNDLATKINTNVVQAATFNLYPNPATSQLNVELKTQNSSDNFTYTIYDISGKIIESDRIGNVSFFTIPTNDFASGLYLLSITNNRTTKTKKFQVVH